MSARASAELRPIQMIGQYIGKVWILCPKCGRAISSRQNWNTWKVKCKTCHQPIVCGIIAWLPSKHAKKRKYVRPIDAMRPGWTSGAPVNVVLSGDLR